MILQREKKRNFGEDGFALLDALEDDEAPAGLRDLPIIDTLRRTWHRHIMNGATAALHRRASLLSSRFVLKINASCP